MPNRALWWVLTAAGTAAIGVSAVALAAGGTSARVTIPAQALGSATATCKPGTIVVADGFAAPRFEPNKGPTVARLTSKRVGPRRVKTRAFNFGQQAGELVSRAYCAKTRHAVRVSSKRVFVDPKGAGSVAARCPRGSEAVGGGFGTPGFSKTKGPRVIPLTSKRVGQRRWKVEGFNMGADGSNGDRPGTLIAYAYCEHSGPKLIVRSKRKTVQKGVLKTLDVRCPGGSRAFSGGFDGNIHLTADPSATGAVVSRAAAHRHAWHTTAFDISDTATARITAYVYCRRS